MLKVNRASYYRWLSPKISKRSIENEDLEERISNIYHNEGERVYGACKIHSSLKKELEKIGRICSIKRVQRIMRKLNLRSITRKKWKPTINLQFERAWNFERKKLYRKGLATIQK